MADVKEITASWKSWNQRQDKKWAPLAEGISGLGVEALIDRIEELEAEIIKRGRDCAVGIVGDPEEVEFVQDVGTAWKAIDAALRLGVERNDEANRLRMENRHGN